MNPYELEDLLTGYVQKQDDIFMMAFDITQYVHGHVARSNFNVDFSHIELLKRLLRNYFIDKPHRCSSFFERHHYKADCYILNIYIDDRHFKIEIDQNTKITSLLSA